MLMASATVFFKLNKSLQSKFIQTLLTSFYAALAQKPKWFHKVFLNTKQTCLNIHVQHGPTDHGHADAHQITPCTHAHTDIGPRKNILPLQCPTRQGTTVFPALIILYYPLNLEDFKHLFLTSGGLETFHLFLHFAAYLWCKIGY